MYVAPWIADWIMMVSDGIAWSSMVLQAITWYLMVFNNIRWYYMVFDGIAGYYISRGIVTFSLSLKSWMVKMKLAQLGISPIWG